MGEVAVARLRLAAPASAAARTRHLVEDALRLAPAGPERLLLVRRLQLGALPATDRAELWRERTARALADQAAHAVHGGDPSAAMAGAVWFRSAAEARALLLRELAAGRRPSAWFWRLAVRDWRGEPLEDWLPRWLALADRAPPEAAALARAVAAAAEAGDLPRIVRALAGSGAGGGVHSRAPAAGPEGRSASPPERTGPEPRTPRADPAATARAVQLFARLSAPARHAFAALVREAETGAAAARQAARWALLAAAPELASSAALLTETTAGLVEALRPPEPVTPTASIRALSAPPPGPTSDMPRSGAAEMAAPAVQRSAVARDVSDAPPPAPDAPAAPTPVLPALAPEACAEAASPVAGVYLLIRPLARMGIGEWLDARPDRAAGGFGRALLAAIARRMGATAHDPALGPLDVEALADWENDLSAWRVGLDRWLRRRARVRLSEVARRRGGLVAAGEQLEVRFPLDSADVRLRRLALDLDPHWTPWLGLCVRYHFRDEPLR